jgi:hypothetical protein
MLLDEKFLFGVLCGKITKYFAKITWNNTHTRRHSVKHGEHRIHLLQKPHGKFKYGVVEVLSTQIDKLKNFTDEDILSAGYKDREDFYRWCRSWYSLNDENDELSICEIEVHNIQASGKEIFKKANIPIPKVRW